MRVLVMANPGIYLQRKSDPGIAKKDGGVASGAPAIQDLRVIQALTQNIRFVAIGSIE
jgi:hypothetical protein